MSNEFEQDPKLTEVRPEDKSEREIDAALEDSFPASDPPSITPMTGMGESPSGVEGRGGMSGPAAAPSSVIVYIGEDEEKYAPVVDAAINAARGSSNAKLIFYDAEAGSRFGSPTTTFWSGDRDRSVDAKVDEEWRLEPADLETEGREVIARMVLRARDAGIRAYGWLPRSRGADEFTQYAERHGADLLILPSDLEDVPKLTKLVKGAADADEIAEKVAVPVITVDVAEPSVPSGQVTLV